MSNAIPSGWEIKTLDEVATVFAGGTPSRSNPAYYDGSVPWVKSGEVNKRLIYRTEEAISELAVKESSAKWAKRGSVLVAMYGATAGKVAKLMIDATLNQAVSAVNRKSETTDNDFLFYAIENNSRELLNTVQGSGQPNLSGQLIKSLNLPIPPFPEQQKIATILSSVDNVIEKTRAQIDKLKDLKTGMMQELLTKGIGHTKFKDSPVGRIPESWSVVRLGDITVEHKQGYYSKERYSENGTYVIRITDMASPKISFTEMPKMVISKDEVEAYRVKEGDFLFARSGAIGRYGIYESKNQAVFASYLIRFRFDPERCINYFIGYCYESDFCQHQIASITQGSSNININANNIKDIMIPLPSVSEQNKICIRLKSLDKRIDLLSLKYQQLNSIKKALMQDLLTGKVRVNLIDKESAVV